MEIEVVSWDKFNPRKDLKSMPWFRLSGDIGYSETLFELTPEQKWLWIFTLSTCTKKVSGKIHVNPKFFAYHSGVKEQNVLKYMQVFENRGLIRSTNGSERIRTDPIENVPNERTNERTNVRARVRNNFDFDRIYNAYPKKEGKKKGMDICASQIVTMNMFHDLEKAVLNYVTMCNNNKTEKRYIKQFSSFMSCWEDYIEIEIEKNRKQEIEDELESMFQGEE